MNIRIDNFFYVTASLGLLLCLVIFGAPVVKPLVFALLLSIMLLPVEKFIEKFIPSRLWAIICTILIIIIVLGAIGTVFFLQGRQIFKELDLIGGQLNQTFDELIHWINTNTPFTIGSIEELLANAGSASTSFLSFLTSGVSTTVSTVALLLLSLLFLLFFMLYRKAFVDFARIQFSHKNRHIINNILENIRHTLVHYLFGLGTVMVIMAIINSLGLWAIGVDYALFFGVLAALLTIIPYFGTTLGGTLPFLYVLATGGGVWQALLVVGFYFSVQQLEGNFITPKIVGDSVKINPFISIVGITIGAYIWGIAGIVLAIPVLGVMRCVFQEIDATKPLALIISSRINANSKKLLTEYDEDRFRLSQLFNKKE